MTEDDWLTLDRPSRLWREIDTWPVSLMAPALQERRLRLFACACTRLCAARHGFDLDPLLDVAEGYVDGAFTLAQLDGACAMAHRAQYTLWDQALAQLAPSEDDTWLAEGPWGASLWRTMALVHPCRHYLHADAIDLDRALLPAVQLGVLHDVYGNPFRPPAVEPHWRTPTVLALARAAYEGERTAEGLLDATRLAVLADALEEDGCSDFYVLKHLRRPAGTVVDAYIPWSGHVRGCHVLDALLSAGA